MCYGIMINLNRFVKHLNILPHQVAIIKPYINIKSFMNVNYALIYKSVIIIHDFDITGPLGSNHICGVPTSSGTLLKLIKS